MRFGSICSGIEAASVAWHPLGWRTSFMSEIDQFPRSVLAHHYPETPLHGDFTTISAGDYEPIDLLVGGTPCQSFSIAGLRGGLGDGRGNLALEYCRLANRLRPRWLVWENVPGVLSSNGGRDFGSILGALVKLGYGVAYRVLDAQYVRVDRFGRAVPQRRRRVFVVGYLGDWRRAAAVLFERESLLGNSAPCREAREGTTCGTLTGTSPGGGWRIRADEAAAGHLVASTLDASFARLQGASGQDANHGHSHLVAHSLSADGFDASEDGTGRGTPLAVVANPLRGQENMAHRADMDTLIPFDTTQITSKANRSKPQSGDPCHPLVAQGDAPAIAFDCKVSGQNGFGVGEIASTQRAMGHADSHTNGGGHRAVAYPTNSIFAVRRLMPVECERLQGFPDGYTAVPYRGKPAADGPRYKALGNSMACNCMAWIGHRIQMIEELTAAPPKEMHR